MKKFLLALGPLLFAATAHAQWKTETYTLKGGWNAIYLHGDASYDSIDNLLPNTGATANITEIWSWNPNPNQVQFMDSQMIPSVGTSEWSVWKRGDSASSTLSKLAGQHAYLVKCTGTASSSYTVTLKQSPQLPGNSWVRNGANLLGFPTFKNGSTFPTFASYFATFPAAIASSSKVFKYAGGDLGATNPVQLFSTTSERADRNQAYWFSAKVAGEYYAPLEFSLSTSGGLHFGRGLSDIKLRIRNRTNAPVTATLTPTASESEPSFQTPVAGSVSLMRRTFTAATATWSEAAFSTAATEVIAPQATVELSFGINRTSMTGSVGSLYASLLRITESSNLMDVYLPVSAKKDSLAGLWVGDISLNSVSNKVSNPARATATLTNGVVTALTVDGSGGSGYTTPPIVTLTAPAANDMKLATATAAANSTTRVVSSITLADGGFGYPTAPLVTLSAPLPSVAATATAVLSAGTVTSLLRDSDGSAYRTAPTITLSAPPASSTATAVAQLTGKSVGAIEVSNGGGYYSSAPAVAISAPPARVTATATLSGTAANWSIAKGAAGTGYATVPAVTISGGTGSGATATAALGLTADSFSITPGNMTYSVAPTVTISGGGTPTVPATATAILSSGSVTGITITNMGAGYTTAPTLAFSGGTTTGGEVAPSAVGNATQFAVSTVVKGVNGTYTVMPTTATIAAPPTAVQATATASIASGLVTGFTVTNGGTGYTSTPTVTLSGGAFVTPVTATFTATLSSDKVTSTTRVSAGAGYTSPPTVTFSAPPASVQATATATVSNNRVTGFTLTDAGSGYFSAPTVTLATPSLGAQPASAVAQVRNGSVTGFTIIAGGSGYAVTPKVTIAAPPAQAGTATPGTFKLRALLHVADNGVTKLLSKAYLGPLAVAPNDLGIATSQSLLNRSSLASARRISAAHLPAGRVFPCSGNVASGSSLACSVSLPYNDPTNPFVHSFHPDHDNKDARFAPVGEGVESYTVNRAATFTFSSTPPSGGVVAGWGSNVIGGTYREIITGLHSSSIQLDGTFELRRVSEIGILSEDP
jgi:hypothetical protein